MKAQLVGPFAFGGMNLTVEGEREVGMNGVLWSFFHYIAQMCKLIYLINMKCCVTVNVLSVISQLFECTMC